MSNSSEETPVKPGRRSRTYRNEKIRRSPSVDSGRDRMRKAQNSLEFLLKTWVRNIDKMRIEAKYFKEETALNDAMVLRFIRRERVNIPNRTTRADSRFRDVLCALEQMHKKTIYLANQQNECFQSFAYNEKQMLYRVFSSPEFTPTKFEPRPPPVKPEGFARPSRRKRAYRPLNIPGPLQPSKPMNPSKNPETPRHKPQPAKSPKTKPITPAKPPKTQPLTPTTQTTQPTQNPQPLQPDAPLAQHEAKTKPQTSEMGFRAEIERPPTRLEAEKGDGDPTGSSCDPPEDNGKPGGLGEGNGVGTKNGGCESKAKSIEGLGGKEANLKVKKEDKAANSNVERFFKEEKNRKAFMRSSRRPQPILKRSHFVAPENPDKARDLWLRFKEDIETTSAKQKPVAGKRSKHAFPDSKSNHPFAAKFKQTGVREGKYRSESLKKVPASPRKSNTKTNPATTRYHPAEAKGERKYSISGDRQRKKAREKIQRAHGEKEKANPRKSRSEGVRNADGETALRGENSENVSANANVKKDQEKLKKDRTVPDSPEVESEGNLNKSRTRATYSMKEPMMAGKGRGIAKYSALSIREIKARLFKFGVTSIPPLCTEKADIIRLLIQAEEHIATRRKEAMEKRRIERDRREAKLRAQREAQRKERRKAQITKEVERWAKRKSLMEILNQLNGCKRGEKFYVHRRCSYSPVYKAYRKACLKVHPDKNMDSFEGHATATEQFKVLNEMFSEFKRRMGRA